MALAAEANTHERGALPGLRTVARAGQRSERVPALLRASPKILTLGDSLLGLSDEALAVASCSEHLPCHPVLSSSRRSLRACRACPGRVLVLAGVVVGPWAAVPGIVLAAMGNAAAVQHQQILLELLHSRGRAAGSLSAPAPWALRSASTWASPWASAPGPPPSPGRKRGSSYCAGPGECEKRQAAVDLILAWRDAGSRLCGGDLCMSPCDSANSQAVRSSMQGDRTSEWGLAAGSLLGNVGGLVTGTQLDSSNLVARFFLLLLAWFRYVLLLILRPFATRQPR